MKTFRFLSWAALAVWGACIASCVKEETPEVVEPAAKDNIVVCTTTVSFGETKALTADGVKTFAAGETMAVIYKNTSGTTVKATSVALTADDIANEGKSATFTFELNAPDKSQDVTYVYPAWMANTDGTPRYSALYTNQNGTLNRLATQHDYCTNSGPWTAGALPSLTLENQLAILAITLKSSDGSSNITGDVTGLTLSDGTYTYNVTGHDPDGHIYVGILPTGNADIEISAKAGAGYYTKTLTGKTYQAGNGYSVSWRMSKTAIYLGGVTEDMTAEDGDVLTGTLGTPVNIYIADGATVTLDGVSINDGGSWEEGNYAALNCLGDATIILKDGSSNTLKGFNPNYPGIYVPSGSTLTIQGETAGTGSLTTSSNAYGAGIGGGPFVNCGNIVIEGGIISATGRRYSGGIGGGTEASCGNITITGGTITAVGGDGQDGVYNEFGGAGIGSGSSGSCGDITISSGVTSLVATKGPNANCVGAGESGTCGTVTIGGVVYWDGTDYKNYGENYLLQNTLTYTPSIF